MVKRAAVMPLAVGIVGQVSAHERDFLARFEGGIGVIPVSNGAGPANADGTLPNVRLNVVRGVSPGAGPLTDVEASYQLAGYRLAIGAQNLFDVFPDRNSTVNSFNGIQTFPRQSPFGMNGRAIYARIGRKF
jgi:iron complex outermembrane receptor protein